MSDKYEVVTDFTGPMTIEADRMLLEHRKNMVYIFDQDDKILFAAPEMRLIYVKKVS